MLFSDTMLRHWTETLTELSSTRKLPFLNSQPSFFVKISLSIVHVYGSILHKENFRFIIDHYRRIAENDTRTIFEILIILWQYVAIRKHPIYHWFTIENFHNFMAVFCPRRRRSIWSSTNICPIKTFILFLILFYFSWIRHFNRPRRIFNL